MITEVDPQVPGSDAAGARSVHLWCPRPRFPPFANKNCAKDGAPIVLPPPREIKGRAPPFWALWPV